MSGPGILGASRHIAPIAPIRTEQASHTATFQRRVAPLPLGRTRRIYCTPHTSALMRGRRVSSLLLTAVRAKEPTVAVITPYRYAIE